MALDRSVSRIPDSDTWTPEQALAAAGQEGYDQVMVIGWAASGELVIKSSRMTTGDAVLLLRLAELDLLGR